MPYIIRILSNGGSYHYVNGTETTPVIDDATRYPTITAADNDRKRLSKKLQRQHPDAQAVQTLSLDHRRLI